jgi:hypothetical protein
MMSNEWEREIIDGRWWTVDKSEEFKRVTLINVYDFQEKTGVKA